MKYRLVYSEPAKEHLRSLPARQRAIVLDTVDRQLPYQPTVVTRNRKRMDPNPIAPWELRIGTIRVYYGVLEEPEPTVEIYGIGIKVRDRVQMGDEELEFP